LGIFSWLLEVVQVSFGAIANTRLVDAFSFVGTPARSARCEVTRLTMPFPSDDLNLLAVR